MLNNKKKKLKKNPEVALGSEGPELHMIKQCQIISRLFFKIYCICKMIVSLFYKFNANTKVNRLIYTCKTNQQAKSKVQSQKY